MKHLRNIFLFTNFVYLLCCCQGNKRPLEIFRVFDLKKSFFENKNYFLPAKLFFRSNKMKIGFRQCKNDKIDKVCISCMGTKKKFKRLLLILCHRIPYNPKIKTQCMTMKLTERIALFTRIPKI